MGGESRFPSASALDLGGEIRAFDGIKTLKEIFEQQAALTPKHVALEDTDGIMSLSYEEVDALADALANLLRCSYGIGPESRVCLAAERTVETMLAMLAILKAGGAYVPLGLRYPDVSLREMIHDISPLVILCSEDCAGRFYNIGANPLYIVKRVELAHMSRPSRFLNTQRPSGNNLAYIIFTSGTTGKPKGVMMSNASVARYIDSMRQLIEPTQHERVIQIMELTFDSSVFDIWVAWAFGGTVVLCDKWTALEGLAEFIRNRKITCLGCTPTQLSLISPEDVPDLHMVAIGGEAVTPSLIEKWSLHRCCRIYNQYGPTEACVTCTSIQCSPGMKSPKSIGYANPGSVKLYIVDPDGIPVDCYAAGELCIAGPQLALGYFNRPDLTAEKFVLNKFSRSPETPVMYRTGDLCRWLSDGSVEYIGRIDSQVKLRGFRIELGEIESKVLEDDDIRACAVALKNRKSPEKAPFLCAYLVPAKAASDIDLSSVRVRLVTSLPDYMIPAAFMILESIPTDLNGKTDRRQLPDPEQTNFFASATHKRRTPNRRSSTIEKCREIFAKVLDLEIEDVGSNSDFFRLGGQSISAARLLSLIRQQFATHIPFADFFVNPTLSTIVSRVEEDTGSSTNADINVITCNRKRKTRVKLASAQSRMYYLHQLDPDSPVYNTSAVFDLRGKVDRSRLEEAFRTVIYRHEILRSSYGHDLNGVFQIVHDGAEFSLSLTDLRNCGMQEKLRFAKKAITEFSNTPFHLSCSCSLPIRALLILLEENHSRLVIAAHHIAMDGSSWDVLYRELSAAFANESLPSLPYQFADFCEWEDTFRQSLIYHQQLRYWTDEIGDDPVDLELSSPQPLLGTPASVGETLAARFEGLGATLRTIAASHATTPFTILLAAFFTLLYHVTGQNEIIVGILSSGRTQPNTDHLIGMLVNTLPLKIKLEASFTFENVVERVIGSMSRAFANQDVAFEDIVRQCSYARNPGRNPIVKTMLTMDDYGETGSAATPSLDLEGLGVTEISIGKTTTAMFDFSIGCSIDADDLLVEAEYATNVLDKSAAGQYVDRFRSILIEAFQTPRLEIFGNQENMDTSSHQRSIDIVRTDFRRRPLDSFMEPESTEEVRFARMFCEVLDLPRVDIRDSFFILGGDSLLSLRLVALARSIGYYINVSHVLELETVQKLASFLLSASYSTNPKVPLADEKATRGPIDLLPIQRWFFNEEFPAPSHYNQSRLFQVHADAVPAIVETCLLELVRHHDALRLSFRNSHSSLSQEQHETASASRFLSFRFVNVSNEMFNSLSAEIEREASRGQSSLDIENGPLIAGTLIKCPTPHPPLLSLVIHHLVVDEVSWRVIMDDLNLACCQLMSGEPVHLPPKSHSFAQWSSALRRYSTSPELVNEVKYWQHAESSDFKLPIPSLSTQNMEREADEEEISTCIPVLGTPGCKTRVTAVRNLFVAAFAFSLAELQANSNEVCILLEGHGREDVVAQLDLSRTVGWFTTVFPVRFDFRDVNTTREALLKALECLRNIPNNGIGYGLLKYPHAGPSYLSDSHASQVTFNYLGRTAPVHNRVKRPSEATDLIVTERHDFPCGSDWDPRNHSSDSILDVSCHMIGDCLEASLRFRSDLLSSHYVQQLGDKFATNLLAMNSLAIAHNPRLDGRSLLALQGKLKDAVSKCWQKHRNEHDSFHGMAVSAVFEGKVIFSEGYGYRDATHSVLVDAQTVFSLGSTGKPMVSFLAGVLVDEHVVDLDEPLAKLLDEANITLPSVYRQMSLRHLLTMTAGIPFIDDGLEETVDDPFEICRQINVVHEPGTHYYYSNFSYALAGYFLALSVGVKDGITDFQNLAHLFLRLLQNKVLSPIGMNDAETEDFKLFRESGDKLGTGHARNEVGSAAMLPSGPVKGSVSDIASFLITEFQKGVSPMGLRVASSHQVTQRFNISSSLGYDWGMGWFRDRTHGFLHASGQWADNASGLMIDPETGLGLSFVLSVRDSTRLNYMDLDMDCLFIDLLNVLRQQQTI